MCARGAWDGSSGRPSGRAAGRREAGRAAEGLGLLLDVVDAAAQEERLLGDVVVLALGQLLERGDGLLDRHELAGLAGEGLRDEERLRQEALDAAGAVDEDLVVLAELVDAEDGDDVLQVLVALQDALHLAGDVVVLLADVAGSRMRLVRVERVDGRVDAQLGDGARQHRSWRRGGRRWCAAPGR